MVLRTNVGSRSLGDVAAQRRVLCVFGEHGSKETVEDFYRFLIQWSKLLKFHVGNTQFS